MTVKNITMIVKPRYINVSISRWDAVIHQRAVRKKAGSCKNGRVKLNHLLMHRLSIPSYLSRIVLQPAQSSLCCPRQSSGNPSNLASVYRVPALHIFPPSTPFQVYGARTFFTRAQTIWIFSDPLYSPFFSVPGLLCSPPHLLSLNSIHSWHSN